MKLHYIALPLLLTACTLAPETTVPTDRVPDAWLHSLPATPAPAAGNWKEFGNAELKKLTAAALARNTDIGAALARIEQSRASATIAAAGLYPSVDASGSVGRTRTSSGTVRTVDDIGASLSVSYEIDLWRKNRAMADAAEWQLQATQFDKAALARLVTAEVARLYTGVLAFDARVAVAENNLANAREVLRITELRHEEGAISGLEEAQQRTSVKNTEASLASLKNQRDLFFNQLALVTGTSPADLKLEGTQSFAGLKLTDPPLSSPWQVIQQRPDIAAQEARLRAANMDIGVARANALPGLSLGLNGGVSGNPSTTLVGLAASFFAPIFQGGALEGAIARSEAVRDEQNVQYQAVLLTAFREIEDALSNYEAAITRRDALAIAADEARRAESIARVRFKEGSIDFTTLVTTQNALLQAEDSYLAALQDQFAARIDLARAMGEDMEG